MNQIHSSISDISSLDDENIQGTPKSILKRNRGLLTPSRTSDEESRMVKRKVRFSPYVRKNKMKRKSSSFSNCKLPTSFDHNAKKEDLSHEKDNEKLKDPTLKLCYELSHQEPVRARRVWNHVLESVSEVVETSVKSLDRILGIWSDSIVGSNLDDSTKKGSIEEKEEIETNSTSSASVFDDAEAAFIKELETFTSRNQISYDFPISRDDSGFCIKKKKTLKLHMQYEGQLTSNDKKSKISKSSTLYEDSIKNKTTHGFVQYKGESRKKKEMNSRVQDVKLARELPGLSSSLN